MSDNKKRVAAQAGQGTGGESNLLFPQHVCLRLSLEGDRVLLLPKWACERGEESEQREPMLFLVVPSGLQTQAAEIILGLQKRIGGELQEIDEQVAVLLSGQVADLQQAYDRPCDRVMVVAHDRATAFVQSAIWEFNGDHLFILEPRSEESWSSGIELFVNRRLILPTSPLREVRNEGGGTR
ncbi:hypothetical protein OAO01_05765 [Oligoflexia bacterium]|nr:hypothetical protein [Oligoflexia bacterium]